MSIRPEALICDIQRFSVHDGPGIRTTVFFKGCPLRCQWCHNPETIRFENEPVYSPGECIGCGDCVSACPERALSLTPSGVAREYARCTSCFQCAEVCPSGAQSPAARAYTSEALLDEVLRDLDYYEDGGGITLSGGEPLAQLSFLKSFVPAAKQRANVHITAETAGHWSYLALREVLPAIDLFLFDLKVFDAQRHQQLTGRTNAMILENLERLVADGRAVEVRLPLVSGCNADAANLRETAQFLQRLGLPSITLLPYHALGESKVKKIDALVTPHGLRAPKDEEMVVIREIFAGQGIEVRQG